MRDNLELDVSLSADGNVAANVRVLAVLLQKLDVADENLAQPLEDLRIVEDLVLDQLLRYREQHLRTDRRTTRYRTLVVCSVRSDCQFFINKTGVLSFSLSSNSNTDSFLHAETRLVSRRLREVGYVRLRWLASTN